MAMIGKFNDIGNEYEILKPDLKRPMVNYFWNKKILSAVNQNGGGNGGYRGMTSQYIGEIGKPRAQLLGNGNRYFYIKDNETGKLWNPGWYPVKETLDEYQCVHGLGYSSIYSTKDKICVTLHGTVSHDEPAEMWQVRILNKDEKARSVTIYPFVEFDLKGYQGRSEYESWVRAYYDADKRMIFAENNAEERPYDWFHGFCSTDYEVTAFETSKNSFIGTYGDVRMPKAIEEGMLGNSLAACETMIGVFEWNVKLAAGEEKVIHFAVGSANSRETAERISAKVLEPGRFEEALRLHAADKEKLCSLMNIQTPDKKVNDLANYWLKQQVQLCVEVGRAGSKGFRDQLQDSWGIVAFNPALAREKILETLEHIHESGACAKLWNPLRDEEYSDLPTWVAPTINAYIKETGDVEFLKEKVCYMEGKVDTVWEHILTTTRYSSDDMGPHNLVLAHMGEWNDSLNGLGRGGKGESVWTSIALYQSLHAVAEIAREIVKDASIEKEMLERAERIKRAVNEYGWDGEWYLTGYQDDSTPVGSKVNKEGMIYLNGQTWATMLGIADEERTEKCLAAVDKYLDCDYGPLTCYPPYTKYDPKVGRITGFVPGVWENGTTYCHGAAFKVVSDFIQGRGNEGYETLLKIMPDSKWNPSEHSGCEPYAFTNMYLGPDNPRKGETSFAWITGTGGWVYRSIAQYMLGFHPEHNGFSIDPCIPKDWKRVTGMRQFRGDIYEIEIINESGSCKGVRELYVDGTKMETDRITVFGDEKNHKIKVVL
ncbi:MAG: hypothetical protein IKK03_03615 [Lachnospiraceae bacterium]|nr:hypothetical protein [Lachnospiraceae bacterium]